MSRNEKFLSFLQSYGPWNNSVTKFDEYANDCRKKYGFDALEIKIPTLNAYQNEIVDLIENKRSQLVLISGNAGDGKTYFLRHVMIALGLLKQGEPLQSLIKACRAPYDDAVDNPRVGQREVNGVYLTFVKDLSDTFASNYQDSDSTKKLANGLFDQVKEILEHASSQETDSKRQPHVMIIAGNKGKLVEFFECLVDDYDNSAVRDVIKRLKKYLISEVDYRKPQAEPGVSVFDMASCIDRGAVAELFKQVVWHEGWNRCTQCDRCGECPVVMNLLSLRGSEQLSSDADAEIYQTLAQQRFEEIFTLIQDSGAHMTMRSLILVLINAILGRDQGGLGSGFWTCRKVVIALNNIDCNEKCQDKSKEKSRLSEPFNNLLGLNLFNDPFTESNIPVFRQLALLKVGEFSTKSLDDQITKIPLPDFAQWCENKDKDAVVSQLKSLRRRAFFTCDFVQTSSAAAVSPVPYDKADAESVKVPVLKGSPFSLTAFKFGAQYMQIRDSKCADDTAAIASRLLVGLNRAFTHLMVSDSQNRLYVSTNNKFAPAAFCVLYGEGMKIPFKGLWSESMAHEAEKSFLCLYVEISKPATLRYQDARSDDDGSVDLVLTPRMFEYLMALGHGYSAISFSHECHEDINAFKDKITSRLKMQFSAYAQAKPEQSDHADKIEICDVECGSIKTK